MWGRTFHTVVSNHPSYKYRRRDGRVGTKDGTWNSTFQPGTALVSSWSRTTKRPAGVAGCGPERGGQPGTVQERRYDNALTTMRSACVLSTNFHAYTLRFRCLPRPWRARAWRVRRLKKGRHWRRRRTLISYLKSIFLLSNYFDTLNDVFADDSRRESSGRSSRREGTGDHWKFGIRRAK